MLQSSREHRPRKERGSVQQTVTALSLTAAEAAFLRAGRVARLATVGTDGTPHLVPVCYDAVFADGALVALHIALDEKPKQLGPGALKRVRNLLANPAVSLLVDRYDD